MVLSGFQRDWTIVYPTQCFILANTGFGVESWAMLQTFAELNKDSPERFPDEI